MLFTIVAVSVAAPRAHAEPSIAVPNVEGTSTKTIRRQLRKIVKDEAKLVSYKRTMRYFKKAKYKKSPGKALAKLKADAVVFAELKPVRRKIRGKKRKRYRLRIKVFGADGERVDKFKLYLRQRSLRTKERRAVAKRLRKVFAELEGEDEGDIDDGDDDDDDGDGDGDGDDGGDGDDDDSGDGDDKRDDAPLSAAALAEYQARGRAVIANAGFAVGSRSLAFNTIANLDDPPRGYSGFPFGGLRFEADIYPGAFDKGSDSPLRNIGLHVRYHNMLFISSNPEDRPEVDLPTSQSGYGVAVGYRHPIGSAPDGPTAFASLGYNRLEFDIDLTDVPDDIQVDVPSVSYAYIDPGVGIRVPIGEKAAVHARAHFYYVTKTGEVSLDVGFGDGRVLGFGGGAGFDYLVTDSVFVRASVITDYFAFDFDGTGALTDRDGDGNQDVGGARDLFFSAGLSAGYVY